MAAWLRGYVAMSAESSFLTQLISNGGSNEFSVMILAKLRVMLGIAWHVACPWEISAYQIKCQFRITIHSNTTLFAKTWFQMP